MNTKEIVNNENVSSQGNYNEKYIIKKNQIINYFSMLDGNYGKLADNYNTLLKREEEFACFFCDDVKFKDLDTARLLLYVLALRDPIYADAYKDFMVKYFPSLITEEQRNKIKKACYMYCIRNEKEPKNFFDLYYDEGYKCRSIDMIKKDFSDIKLHAISPITYLDCSKMEEKKEPQFFLRGYRYKKKAHDIHDIADEMFEKMRYTISLKEKQKVRDKLIAFSEKNFKKYGYVLFLEIIAYCYYEKKKELFELSDTMYLMLQNLHLSLDEYDTCQRAFDKMNFEQAYSIVEKHFSSDSYYDDQATKILDTAKLYMEKVMNSYDVMIEYGWEKAKKAKEDIIGETMENSPKERLEELSKRFALSCDHLNEAGEIALLLTGPEDECRDLEKGKQLLEYYFSRITLDNLNEDHWAFFLCYSKRILLNENNEVDLVLANTLSCCEKGIIGVSEKSSEEIGKSLEVIKQRLYKVVDYGNKEQEKMDEYNHNQWKKEEIERNKQRSLEIEQKKLTNIFNLDPDTDDYNPHGIMELNLNLTNKKNAYYLALCSDIEMDIVKKLDHAASLLHTKALIALCYYYLEKRDNQRFYSYFFRMQYYMHDSSYTKDLFNKFPLPINLSLLLETLYKCRNRKDKEYLSEIKEFISIHLDLENELSDEDLKALENYACKNFDFAIKLLNVYDEKHHRIETIDNLYELTLRSDYYIDLLIDKLGGVEAELNDRFVQFLLSNEERAKSMNCKKSINFHLARLYLDKELCEKYNIVYSLEKVKTTLYLAYAFGLESNTSAIDYALNEMYAKCFEYGIGTSIDYDEALKIYDENHSYRGKLLREFLSCIPYSLKRVKNFVVIKDYFLENVKMIDYRSIFEEVKRFDNADYPLEEIFDKEGKYIGYTLMDKLVEKEAEIKRQEKLRRQAELKRQEDLKRQAELKKQEELRRQAEQSVINSQNSEISGTKQSPSTTEMIKSNENTISINEIRSRYDRPQGNDEKALKEYFKRLCEAEKPALYKKLKDEYAPTAEYNYIMQILGLPKERVLNITEFESKLKELIKYDCTPSVDVKFKVNGSITANVNALERFIAGLPVYMGTLYINVSFLQNSKFFSGVNSVSSTLWNNEIERFKETNASKFISAAEYAEKSGLNRYTADLEGNEQWRGKDGLRKHTRACINMLLSQYKVVGSAFVSVQTGFKKTSELIPCVINDIKTTFQFLGDQ